VEGYCGCQAQFAGPYPLLLHRGSILRSYCSAPMDNGNCGFRTAQSAQDDRILTEDRGIGRNYSRYTLGRCPVKMINAPLSGPSLSAEEIQHCTGRAIGRPLHPVTKRCARRKRHPLAKPSCCLSWPPHTYRIRRVRHLATTSPRIPRGPTRLCSASMRSSRKRAQAGHHPRCTCQHSATVPAGRHCCSVRTRRRDQRLGQMAAPSALPAERAVQVDAGAHQKVMA
jgi:hypothetical protein